MEHILRINTIKAALRLIFTLEGERLEIVRVEGVSKHYED
jgi:hypothetical protein